MANPEHLQILRQGVETWNQWREQNWDIIPDIREANLSGANLQSANLVRANLVEANLDDANLVKADLTEADLAGANLRGVTLLMTNLRGANLRGVDLRGVNLSGSDPFRVDLFRADLRGADLRGANLYWIDLSGANLPGADLRGADLRGANLTGVDLHGIDLSGVNLRGASLHRANLAEANLAGASLNRANLEAALLLETNFERANLAECSVYGASAWNVNLTGANQKDLIITRRDEPVITVDNLEVAQFIYLLLNNDKIRRVIDTITSKAVLILGRFTPKRKAVLNAIRKELRKYDYVPVVFDFDKPASRDTHETITTLARMARFVIADITEPRSIPQELVSIVETLPSVPVKPILKQGCEPWGMYDHIRSYPWVLKLHRYRNVDDLILSLEAKVITPVAARANKLLKRKVK